MISSPTGAARLRALHRPGRPVVLANAWDAATARAVVRAGFPAVATSSAAMAATLGYGDGEATPPGEMLDAVARIVRAVDVPVTADLERGYGAAPAELVDRLLATGAVGCNLEDSEPRTGEMVDAGRQADFLAAVRRAAGDRGADLVLNARIDTYLRRELTGEAALADAVERAGRYLAAGADCVFPLLATDPADIRALVAATGGRVNVLFLGGPGGTPSLAGLAGLGVARVSFGGSLHQHSLRDFDGALAAIREGTDPFG